MQSGFTARVHGAEHQAPFEMSDIGDHNLQRIVADYIAGMTDRFAMREHQRLTGQNLLASAL